MNQIAVLNTPVSLVDIRLHPDTYPRISRIAKPFVLRDLAVVISKALLYRGQDAEAEKVAFISSSLYDELMADEQKLGLPFLTMEEIRRVANRAALDKDTFGISVTTLYSALCAYAKGEGSAAQKEADALQKAADRTAASEKIEETIAKLAGKFTSTHKIK